MTAPPLRPIEDVVSLLGSRVVAFHPRLVAVTGRVTAGLMLSQSLYWSRKLALARRDSHGWFWKRRQDWVAETGLSRHEQETARLVLRGAGIIEERMQGMPARLWFRVNLNRLATLIDGDFDDEWNWRNDAQVLRLLGRPILFHQPLASICGSVAAAILLSTMLSEERVAFRAGQAGWRRLDGSRIRQTTGLTRHEIEHARQQLRETRVIRERVIGVPPRVEWVMHLPTLADHLRNATTVTTAAAAPESPIIPGTNFARQEIPGNHEKTEQIPLFAENQQTDFPESDQQGEMGEERSTKQAGSTPDYSCGIEKSLNNRLFAENQQTDFPESDQLIFRKVASLVAGNRKISWPESGKTYRGLTTVNPTTEKHPPPTPSPGASAVLDDQRDGGWGSSLIWPNSLLIPERQVAQQLLQPVACKAQLLLDELAGQDGSKAISRPLSYLRALVRQEIEGRFLPSVAHRVAARREQLRQEAEDRKVVAITSASVDPAAVAAKNEKARRMLEQMRRQLGGRGFARAAG